uniref:rhodanese-like domain-containing protein n=1 Tax=Flavobacterium sp. TaxID=239 RepID=UPI00404927E1
TNPPGYFPSNVLMNINGYESLDDVLQKAKNPLNPIEFDLVANASKALVLDTRDASDFANGFIPNSINIGLDGSFAMWVGEMIMDIKQEILLVTNPGFEEESMIRLSRIGFDHTIGFLEGGVEAWQKAGFETETVQRIEANELEKLIDFEKTQIFDVRKRSEFISEHLVGAINIPLNEINQHLAEIPKNETFVLYCAGGYRSMIAASILKQRGWTQFVDVIGGFKALKKHQFIDFRLCLSDHFALKA